MLRRSWLLLAFQGAPAHHGLSSSSMSAYACGTRRHWLHLSHATQVSCVTTMPPPAVPLTALRGAARSSEAAPIVAPGRAPGAGAANTPLALKASGFKPSPGALGTGPRRGTMWEAYFTSERLASNALVAPAVLSSFGGKGPRVVQSSSGAARLNLSPTPRQM